MQEQQEGPYCIKIDHSTYRRIKDPEEPLLNDNNNANTLVGFTVH